MAPCRSSNGCTSNTYVPFKPCILLVIVQTNSPIYHDCRWKLKLLDSQQQTLLVFILYLSPWLLEGVYDKKKYKTTTALISLGFYLSSLYVLWFSFCCFFVVLFWHKFCLLYLCTLNIPRLFSVFFQIIMHLCCVCFHREVDNLRTTRNSR